MLAIDRAVAMLGCLVSETVFSFNLSYFELELLHMLRQK
jgi:hypothetical protein